MKPDGTGTAQSTGTIQEAASAFAALMTPPKDKQPDDEAKAGEEAAAAEAADDETPDPEVEDKAAEAAEDETEGETEGQESPDDEQEPVKLYTVRVDGKEEQVPESELIAGYSRTSDYTRKTQQVAEQRKALDAETVAARQERAEYATLLPKLRAALETGMGPEPNWAELRQKDPVAAALQWQEREERKQKLAGLTREEQRIAEAEKAEHEEQAEQVMIEQRNKLIEKLPAWRDEKVAGKDAAAIQATLRSVGYAESEMEIYDHRAMLIAWKAAKYDEAVARQKGIKPKVAKVPVVAPGGGVRQSVSVVDQASSRFKKSGSVRDAAGLFEALLS